MDSSSDTQEVVTSMLDSEKPAYIQEWLKQDKERIAFIQEQEQKLALKDAEIHRLRAELDDQTGSLYQYQEIFDHLRAKNKKYQDIINKDPYVAVLIDGDGVKFQDSLLRGPGPGAREAVWRLKQEVVDCLKDTPLGGNVAVFARVFANVNRLAKTLHDSKIITSAATLYQFVEEFTKYRSEFDFVDVGDGKENADVKMKCMLRFYYDDFRCKKIFFVACHDSGYVHDLDRLDADEESRIVLVEAEPAHPNIRNLGLPMTRFDSVFRKEPLPGYAKPSRSVTPQPKTGGSRLINGASYGAGGRTNGHQSTAVQRSKATSPKVIEWNKNGERLDPPVKSPDNPRAQDGFDDKCSGAKGGKFCFNHHLKHACRWGSMCHREHEIELTNDELVILELMARRSKCRDGPKCMEFDCHRSHHCPRGLRCTRGDDCKFNRHLTEDELKPVKRWHEGQVFPEPIESGSV